MAFTTQRGRPRKEPHPETDIGTPELRLKHALRLTAEPIDLLLEKSIITPRQHWCGLHLRWLYTLRYGAPSITTRYADREAPQAAMPTDENWRAMREREYLEATDLLKRERHCNSVMRVAVFNEQPASLNHSMMLKASSHPALRAALSAQNTHLRDGLELLARHWQRTS